MGTVDVGLSPKQRERLAQKGRILFGKSCGTDGKGLCAESFALFHLWQGEPIVARDLLAFLESRIEALKAEDPENRLTLTETLADRLRKHLAAEADEPPDPSRWTAILKAKKQPL